MGIDEGVEDMKPIEHWSFEQVVDPYYVLVMKAEKQVRNGFRYIKELLLQGHNLKLMQAYDLLTNPVNGVSVFSVKTDCSVVRAKD